MPAETPLNRKERKDRKERTSLLFSKQNLLFAFLAFFAVIPTLATAEDAADPSVRLFDTGSAAAGALTEQDLAAKAGWMQVLQNDSSHTFKGAAVLMNDRVAVVLRPGANGGEVYSNTGKGWRQRVLLWQIPCFVFPWDVDRVKVVSIRIVQNTPGAVAVQATLLVSDVEVSPTFVLAAGQPLVEVRPGEEGPGYFCVCYRAPYVVVPSFFGDDLVFGTGNIRKTGLTLPPESCVLSLLEDKQTIVACSWRTQWLDMTVFAVPGKGEARLVGAMTVGGSPEERVWVAFLEGQDIWHERSVPATDAGKALDWRPPFAAKWRADRIGKEGFAESMTFESPPALAPGRYVIYPLDRTKATPLTEFTVVDILRNTLGVGPCQYILETEGLASADNPTPDSCLTWVEKQVKKKGGKDAADDIRERLKAMVELVGRTEARIKRYADFAAEMKQSFAADSSRSGLEIKATIDAIAQAAAAGLAATEPPGRVAKLADAVAGLIGKDTAAADLAAPAADLRAIGAAQDRALAKSRMAVRWLGCQGRTSELAKRTDAFLQGK